MTVASPSRAVEAHLPRERPERLVWLDALRFVAAAGVLLFHYTARWSEVWGSPPEEVFPHFGRVISYAALGPEQFFVISGFVILMTAWGRDVPHVVASRIARLYPAYWTAVLLTGGLLLFVWPTGKDIQPAEVAVNLTLLQSLVDVRHVDGVYWTLWVELRFYALVVLFVALGITRRRILAVCAVWPPLAVLAVGAGVEPFATALLGVYAPLFAGGMVLYVLYRDGHAPWPWVILAGNVALAVHLIVPRQVGSLSRNTGFVPSELALGVGVVVCFATVAVLSLTRLRHSGPAWAVTVGALTYPLYLTHEYWGWWVIQLAHPTLGPWPTVGLATVVAVGLAVAIHYVVERPFGPRFRAWLLRVLRRAQAVVRRRPAARPEQGTARPPGCAADGPSAVTTARAGEPPG